MSDKYNIDEAVPYMQATEFVDEPYKGATDDRGGEGRRRV